jgi:hypothetical protein
MARVMAIGNGTTAPAAKCWRDTNPPHATGVWRGAGPSDTMREPDLAMIRKGGRVVDCTGLENRQRRKAFEGSNPSPSAGECVSETWVGHLRGQMLFFSGIGSLPGLGR